MAISETAQLVVNMNLKGDFRQGMKGAQKDLRGFTTQTGKTDKQLTGLRGRLRSPELKQGLLQGVGLSGGLIGFQLLSQGIGATVNAVGDAVGAASDLTESQSKVDEVFQDSAPTIRRWAADLSSAYGLTEQAALESAGTLGNFVQALGLSQDEAVGLSQDITTLAGDLASFNNVATSDVLVALRAGLAGETEPVRRLGIDISAARVEALLLAKGVQKVNGEFTQAQKVAARYEAIMSDTATAQGDAERTADTLAGKQRQLDAVMGDLSATIGGIVIGPATDFLGFLVDVIDLSPKVSDRVSGINKRLDEMRAATEGVVDAADDIEEAYRPLTKLDLPTLLTVGRDADLGEPLLELANRLRFTEEELRHFVDTNNNSTTSLREAIDLAEQAYYAYDPLSSITVRVADGTAAVAVSSKAVSREFLDFTDAARALNRALGDGASVLGEFRDEADAIADTRSLGKINEDLQKQIRLRNRAAREGKVAAFAAAEAAIQQLEEEKRLRQLGKRAAAERKKDLEGVNAKQRLVTAGIADTKKEAKRLLTQTRKKYGIKVSVNDKQLANAIAKAKELATALSLISGTVLPNLAGLLTGNTPPPKQSGGPVQAGRAYVVGEQRPELFVPNQNGRIIPNVPSGGGDISVYVTPSLVVAAAQVEDQTTKAVRTQRFREKN